MRAPWWVHPLGVLADVVFATWTLVTVLVCGVAQLVALPFDPYRRVAATLARWTWGLLHFRSQPFWRTRIDGAGRCAGGPWLVVANHQSLLDIPVLMMLPLAFRVIARPGVFRMPVYGWMARLGGHVELDPEAPDAGLAQVRRLFDAGISVVVFPEGTRSDDGTLGAFQRGAFQVALDCGVPVLPVCIDGTRHALPKGRPYGLVPVPHLHVDVLAPLPPEGNRRAFGQRTRAVLEDALAGPDPWTLARRTGERYAPLGRWRQGWAEGKTFYDPVFWALTGRLPREGRIVDVGGGEGLLAAWLGAAGSEASVHVVDVDADRVAVAQRVGVDAVVGDARTAQLGTCDALVCIDVLHYLPPAEQAAVVARFAAALRPGGLLVLRDPEVGRGARSRWTTLSERLFVATGRHAGEGVTATGGDALAALLAGAFEDVRTEDCSTGPFANVLVSGRRMQST